MPYYCKLNSLYPDMIKITRRNVSLCRQNPQILVCVGASFDNLIMMGGAMDEKLDLCWVCKHTTIGLALAVHILWEYAYAWLHTYMLV